MQDPMYPNVPTKPISAAKQKRLDAERITAETRESEESEYRKTYIPMLFALMAKLSEYDGSITINEAGFIISGSYRYNILLPHTLDNVVVDAVKGDIDDINRFMDKIDAEILEAVRLHDAKIAARKKLTETMTTEEIRLLGLK